MLNELDKEGSGVKSINIHYFAILREQAGCQFELVETNALNAEELYKDLQARKSISIPKSFIRVAVNGEFALWDHRICDGDTVVFVPPVSGG